MRALLTALAAAAVLPGCASILSGQNQPVTVEAPNCEGATCKLMNDKGTWIVKAPGSVTVSRAYGDLTVTCSKEGFGAATSTVSSSTKAMAAGNIIFGGLIGVGVDAATGAAYDYPGVISSGLDCRAGAKAVSAER
ncbi:MAG: hypothetical protein KF776_09000 [Burkholderiales bacterium]|nr:hypothetical protein [Burkholderiales bacterium]